MTVYYRAPELPWNDGGQQQRFFGILLGLLLFVVVAGIAIPMIELPAKDRKELEQLPPQLAKVLERKKKEKPKPKPVIKKEKPKPKPEPEKKPEPKSEPKVEKPKPKPPKPEQPKKPKKEQQKPKLDASKQKRDAAKQKARDSVGENTLATLNNITSQVPIAALSTSSKGLNNAGAAATVVGSVVDRSAATRGSGGVDVTRLTTDTAGEKLGDRDVTAVEMTEEQIAETQESTTRSQEELRLAFEQYKVQFDRIYRGALQRNPNLAGSVTLRAEIQSDGSVSSCKVAKSELNNDKVHKRLESKCRQMKFGRRNGVDITVAEYPIKFIP